MEKNWFLTNEHQLSYNGGDPETTTKEYDIEARELGIIPIEKFTRQPVYIESKWKVIVGKAYFYDTPKTGTVPRKAYMLKGDTATGIRVLKNFVEVSFQNNAEIFTSGFILKSDLKKIK